MTAGDMDFCFDLDKKKVFNYYMLKVISLRVQE